LLGETALRSAAAPEHLPDATADSAANRAADGPERGQDKGGDNGRADFAAATEPEQAKNSADHRSCPSTQAYRPLSGDAARPADGAPRAPPIPVTTATSSDPQTARAATMPAVLSPPRCPSSQTRGPATKAPASAPREPPRMGRRLGGGLGRPWAFSPRAVSLHTGPSRHVLERLRGRTGRFSTFSLSILVLRHAAVKQILLVP